MEKLLLIDGHSIVNRAFYGIPPLTNSEGLHTNAIYGFLNIFFNAFHKTEPDYVLVAFDVREKTFRHKLYPEYKGTRKGMPDELHEQVPVLKDVLHAMGIKTVELPGYEADDILGTYAKQAEKEGIKAFVFSGDRDLLQLASETTMVAIPKTKMTGTEVELYYAKDVHEKYQVTPSEFIDLKALMGDSSDNIPGIPGIGEKTATNIIVKYGSLENAYEHVEEITPNKAKNNLKEFIEQGRMSKVLATINTESPVPLDFHEAKVKDEADFFNDYSYDIFKRLELKNLIDKFEQSKRNSTGDISFELHDASEIRGIFNQLNTHGIKEAGIYFSPCGTVTALSFDKDGSIRNHVFHGELSDFLKNICTEKSYYVFDLKNLLHAVHAKNFSASNIFDISIMAYLMNPVLSSYTYDSVAKDYLGKIIPSKEDFIGKKSVIECVASEDAENAFRMAAASAECALRIFPELKKKLIETEMWELFEKVEMPLTYSLYNMEKEGIKVDKKVLNDFSLQLSEMISVLEKEIYEEAGEEFNINSPKQLGVILFDRLLLPHGKKTKTGYSTSADVLEKLADEFPFVGKILEFRQLTKLKSTYADGLVNFIADDGRIHGTFNQTITATGRISSADPNLQNIPTRTELGQEIRKAFVPKEGCVFLDADYSQIELRLLAELSGDESLIEAYKEHADIHRLTASKVFNIPFDEVTKEQRRNAKAVNFGIVYGISSFGLSQGLSISRKEAAEYIKQYFETYPRIKEYLENTVKTAKNDGYTTTLFNRRRPIPELASSNFMQRSFGERAAMNAPIQGSAADIMKIAMINIEKALLENGLRSRIVLQVHDEFIVETVESETDAVREILNFEMQNAADTKVILETEVEEGKDWYSAH